jgi:hypothetical protein
LALVAVAAPVAANEPLVPAPDTPLEQIGTLTEPIAPVEEPADEAVTQADESIENATDHAAPLLAPTVDLLPAIIDEPPIGLPDPALPGLDAIARPQPAADVASMPHALRSREPASLDWRRPSAEAARDNAVGSEPTSSATALAPIATTPHQDGLADRLADALASVAPADGSTTTVAGIIGSLLMALAFGRKLISPVPDRAEDRFVLVPVPPG